MDAPLYKPRLVNSLASVDPAAWNGLANPPGAAFDPFLTWEFLEALESSGAATPEEGWSPHHILLDGPGGELAGAMPLYLKYHSYGEFVFDHAWADAFQRAGGSYYPKLLCAVPFTPVTGRRLLVSPGPDAARLRDQLLSTAIQIAEDNRLSSLHVNFHDEVDALALRQAGFLVRTDQQFHFQNPGYASFDDFLAQLSSARRKNLRKERQRAQEGLTFLHLTGPDITEAHWDAMFAFYIDTGSRKWGTPYLTRESFALIGERMAEHVLLILAMEDGRPIAGALNLIGANTLYGRYWGTVSDRPMLHFETCYYQAMDFAIARGLGVVEAGAQGGHKLARGYVPVLTRSAHWIGHPGLRIAVDRYLRAERERVSLDQEWLRDRTPFRKSE